MSDKCLAVVLTHNFIPGFKATVNSILHNTPNFSYPIVCFDIDLTQEDRYLCLKIYPDIIFKKPFFENYKHLPRHSPTLKDAFFKLESFRLIREYDRVVTVDCDIVFLDSIEPLMSIALKTNVAMCYHATHKEYNTGLVVYNKTNPNTYKIIMAFLRVTKSSHLADQQLLTRAAQRRMISVTHLDNKWNTTKRQYKNGDTNIIGLHFVGKKPWSGGESGYEEIEKVWHYYASLKELDG